MIDPTTVSLGALRVKATPTSVFIRGVFDCARVDRYPMVLLLLLFCRLLDGVRSTQSRGTPSTSQGGHHPQKTRRWQALTRAAPRPLPRPVIPKQTTRRAARLLSIFPSEPSLVWGRAEAAAGPCQSSPFGRSLLPVANLEPERSRAFCAGTSTREAYPPAYARVCRAGIHILTQISEENNRELKTHSSLLVGNEYSSGATKTM